jgi:hypothetical protein
MCLGIVSLWSTYKSASELCNVMIYKVWSIGLNIFVLIKSVRVLTLLDAMFCRCALLYAPMFVKV